MGALLLILFFSSASTAIAYEWTHRDICPERMGCIPLAIGDLERDGRTNIYASARAGHCLARYSWVDGRYQQDIIDDVGDAHLRMLLLGDADNDGAIELYVVTWEPIIYRLVYRDGSYCRTLVYHLADHSLQFTIGDGNNDGQREIYAALLDNTIIQLRLLESEWTCETIWTDSYGYGRYLALGDADNDGVNELYCPSAWEFFAGIRTLFWDGEQWRSEIIYEVPNYMRMGTDASRQSLHEFLDVLVADLEGDETEELYIVNSYTEHGPDCWWENTWLSQLRFEDAEWEPHHMCNLTHYEYCDPYGAHRAESPLVRMGGGEQGGTYKLVFTAPFEGRANIFANRSWEEEFAGEGSFHGWAVRLYWDDGGEYIEETIQDFGSGPEFLSQVGCVKTGLVNPDQEAVFMTGLSGHTYHLWENLPAEPTYPETDAERSREPSQREDTRSESIGWIKVFPNPMPGRTGVQFAALTGVAAVGVLDAEGRLVRKLACGDPSGTCGEVFWDGRRGDGSAAPAGLYWVRLLGESGVLAGARVILVR
jgi:hypothetical protein